MNLDEAIQKIKIGKAVCFLGAGFSRGATDAEGREVLGEYELRKELFKIAEEDFDESVSLPDISNFCNKKSKETARELRLLILNRFTLTNPTVSQLEILKQPWRSVFTTNYDDIVEQAWDTGPSQIFSPAEPDKLLIGGRRLFYLHGRGRDIRSPAIDPLLILTSHEYASSTKAHQKLRDYFSNELATAEAIIFVGYSAKDLDFTRTLAALSGSIKNRILFIEAPNLKVFDRARIEDYGSIATIGTEGLADALRDTDVPDVLRHRPKFVNKISFDSSDRSLLKTATDREIHKQLITGVFDTSSYVAQKRDREQSSDAVTAIVERNEKLDRVFQLLRSGNSRVVVTADVGNGKTFFLRQVEQRGLEEGYQVYRIDGSGPEYSSELQNIVSKPGKKLFVVDDAIRYTRQISLIGSHLTSDCGLVLSNFNSFNRIGVRDLREVSHGQIFEVSVDKMTRAEIVQWRKYLDSWGLWGDRLAGLSGSEKEDYLTSQCGSEIRSTVVGIYKESNVAHRISGMIDYFLNSKGGRNKIEAFIGAVICSLVNRHVEWRNVVDWLQVDEAAFISDITESPIVNILVQRNGEFAPPSKQLARHFLEAGSLKSISKDDISDAYVKIVLGTARQIGDTRKSGDARENLKELMRFRILSLLFGDDHDSLSLISSIYNKLAADPEIQKRDQFWLQFAMSRMADEDIDLAEIYLKNAIGIAKGHGHDWDTKQIDDQFARLWLHKSLRSEQPNTTELHGAVKYLIKSLKDSPDDAIYPLRSLKLIEPALERHVDIIPGELLILFRELFDLMRPAIGKTGKVVGAERGETDVLRKHLQRSTLILNSA
ncbi:SIR2 family protein [Sulfitobacter sp. LCG007]